MNALQEIIEPPHHAYEPVEVALASFLPDVDDFGDTLGAQIDGEADVDLALSRLVAHRSRVDAIIEEVKSLRNK